MPINMHEWKDSEQLLQDIEPRWVGEMLVHIAEGIAEWKEEDNVPLYYGISPVDSTLYLLYNNWTAMVRSTNGKMDSLQIDNLPCMLDELIDGNLEEPREV